MAAPVATSIASTNKTNIASAVVTVAGYSPAPSDYILVLAVYNEHTGTPAATVTSVTSAGVTWALQKRSNSSATGGLELWWTHASGALSGYNITVNFSGAYDDCSIVVIGVTGCVSFTAPFDSNVSLPAAQSAPTATWTPSFTNISTSSTDDLLLYLIGAVGGGVTPGSGFTVIASTGTGAGSWSSTISLSGKVVTALQSSATFTYGSALTSGFGSVTGEAIFASLAGNLPVAPSVDLAGNLGSPSHYGKLSYGLKHYSRINAFVPTFAGDLSLVPVVDLAGGLAPAVSFAADLDVHVNLIDFNGDMAPQIALGGSLSLDLLLTVLSGSFGFTVVYGASSFVSEPLWASQAPVVPPWAPSEPCPPSMWTPIEPCDSVIWKKTELCNG